MKPALLIACAALAADTPASPTTLLGDARAWATDRVWYDGQAEKCVYKATRTIYEKPRSYLAVGYTNKERFDPKTTCKTDDSGGIEVFKHHFSERVPTENYDYDFSTMTYSRADDFAPLKLTAATQDDCGASFKEVWREGAALRWAESIYFPDTGRHAGTLGGAESAQLADALTLTLRDYDFDARPTLSLAVVPSQKDVQRVPYEPVERRVRHAGRATLTLPIGAVDAHELRVETEQGDVEARYWFAADGTAPMLHALVRYEGPQGITYELVSHERTAYWKR